MFVGHDGVSSTLQAGGLRLDTAARLDGNRLVGRALACPASETVHYQRRRLTDEQHAALNAQKPAARLSHLLCGKVGASLTEVSADTTTATAVPLAASPADLSPLGNGMIAFSSRRDSTNGTDVDVMNVDGTDQRRLINNPGDDLASDFPPDGQKLAFHSNRSGLSWPKILIGHAAQEYDRL